MKTRDLVLGAAAAWFALGPTMASAQPADLTTIPKVPDSFKPKKTAWGDPDLRGTWPIDHLNGTPLQRDPKYGNRVFLTDEEFAERSKFISAAQSGYEKEEQSNKIGLGHWAEAGQANRRTSLIISPSDGRLPEPTEEGKRRAALMRSSWRRGQAFDWVTDFDSWDRCITRGLPASMFPFQYNNGMRIFQAPGVVALNMEMIHETRIIPTDGRPPLPSRIRNWLGESRGHWEKGNTLVVETTNLRPGPSVTNVGTIGSPRENNIPISEQARILERFTMTGPDSIVYEITYSDPVVFAAPWTARLDWQRNDKYGMFEYACHEGNVQIRNYITSSRAERAKKAGASQ
ncbi:MAG: hypothetical protein ACM3YM_05435 [Sphingomonadales bacterium]